jgi:hypothetical protein
MFQSKKLLTAVIANKYIIPESSLKSRVKNFLKILMPGKKRKKELIKRMINDNELQTRRLELISFFAENSEIDLFGPGWANLSNLPVKWQSRLKPLMGKIYKGVVRDKIKAISGYKFTLCLENVRFPGYITEKIIDCFVAGTVPLYLGAKDVSDYIPSGAFIDVAKFRDNRELLHFINNISDRDYDRLVHRGRSFLKSDEGKKYSHEAVADLYYDLITRQLR